MAYDYITLEVQEHVALLKLNRPQQLNAFHTPMLEEMNAALDEITAPQSTVRCLLLTGEGRAFSSGADLASGGLSVGGASLDAGHTLEAHYNPLLEKLMSLPIPFVTAVNGPAAGAGCSFAISGDIVLAAKSAYFLQAFVNIGLVPDVGSTWLLPRLVGKARAAAMMMLGEKIPAETAVEWGLVYKVVEDADLMPTALAMAQKLAHGPTQAYRLIRTGLRASLEQPLTDSLLLERNNQRAAGLTEDFKEGVMAFLAKRPAQFQGR